MAGHPIGEDAGDGLILARVQGHGDTPGLPTGDDSEIVSAPEPARASWSKMAGNEGTAGHAATKGGGAWPSERSSGA
jgi:hypothetical protein